MLKKIYRLKEREVKKVLSKSKPFFSYNIVSNSLKNKFNYNRFWIIISSKSVNNNVTRVFFRRLFYDLVKQKINLNLNETKDFVFLVKKQFKLDLKDKKIITKFVDDINFLLYKNKL